MWRKLNQPHLVPVVEPAILLARDIDEVRLKAWFRREMWNFLLELGLVSAPKPAPPRQAKTKPPPHQSKTKLSVVVNNPGENEPGQARAT